jgi:hypothetical protein
VSIEAVEYLKLTFGPAVAFAGVWIARAIWNVSKELVPLIVNAIAEMKMLRASFEEIKGFIPMVEKLDHDVQVSWDRIRDIEVILNIDKKARDA